MASRPIIAAFSALLLVACNAAQLNLPSDAAIRADATFVVDDTEIVVVTHSAVEARSIIEQSKSLGYRMVSSDYLPALGLTMVTLIVPPGQDGSSAIRELERLQPGVTAGVNHGYVPQAEDSAPWTQAQFATAAMQWPAEGCPAHAAIGVLDARLVGPTRGSVVSADFSRSTSVESTLHGAQVVAILESSGLLRSPRIFHADVVSPGTQIGDAASVDALLRGIDWLMRNKVRVINVSLSGPYNKILDRAVTNAARAGVIIIAPVGNNGPIGDVRYPAAFGSTIAVTAIDADRRIYRKAAQGPQVDFSAPGVDVAVGAPSDASFVSGTSFAAPFVAMRIAADPILAHSKNSEQIRSQIAQSSEDLGSTGYDPVFGHGLIKAPRHCNGSL